MKTVFVGLSGGVDSAVSAYLLKKEGYKVVGAFIKGWEPDFLPCTGARDRLEAMRVAAHLNIPFITYDLEKEYKKEVVDYFVEEYRKGRTPNPDVLCNRTIKFGAFWEKAKADGADMIATGHYAQNLLLKSDFNNGRYRLFRGVDDSKDQSYFLWTLTQNDLTHSMFPIGGLQKAEVRTIAKRAGLPNAERKDSQGLCFLGHVDMHSFLKRYIPAKPGFIYGNNGKVVGEHDGVAFYTVGERVPVRTGGKKMYVVAKDISLNTLTASPMIDVGRQSWGEGRKRMLLKDAHWIGGAPTRGEVYEAQTRYHGEKYAVSIVGNSVQFEKSVLAADGQSLVVYLPAPRTPPARAGHADGRQAGDKNSGECLGGGIIAE